MSCSLSYPIHRGTVKKWEEMELLYEYALVDKLEADTEQSSVLITRSPYATKKSMEGNAELLFEVFGVAGLALLTQPELTLYSTGRTTGLVIDSGDDHSSCCEYY